MGKGLMILLLLLATAGITHGQEQVGRYEQLKKDNGEYFTVVSGEEYGLLMVREDNLVRGRDRKWILTFLDTDLNEKWVKELVVEAKYAFKAYEMFKGKLYLVYVEAEKIIGQYQVLEVDLVSGKIVPYVILNQLAFEMTNIIALQDRIVLGGYVRDSPTLLTYTVGENKFDVVPGYFKDKSDIIDLRVNQDGQTYNIVTMERSYSGYFLRLRTYSFDSDYLFEREVKMKDNFQILDGVTLGFVKGNIAIAGSYGSQSSNFVQGLYFAIIRPEGQDNVVKYHDFGEFEHFFDYTSPKRAKKLTEKANVMSERGRGMKLSLRLYLHELKEVNDKFVLFAEVYDQKYDRPGSNYYMNPYDPNFRAASFFNPYRYSNYRESYRQFDNAQTVMSLELLQAVVVGLDEQGDIIWDNSMVVEDLDQATLSTVVDAYIGGTDIHMVYKHEEEIVHKPVPYSSIPVEDNWIPFQLEGEEESIRSTEEEIGGAVHWYDNVFYVWGFHRVSGAEGKRNVIFVNKVVF